MRRDKLVCELERYSLSELKKFLNTNYLNPFLQDQTLIEQHQKSLLVQSLLKIISKENRRIVFEFLSEFLIKSDKSIISYITDNIAVMEKVMKYIIDEAENTKGQEKIFAKIFYCLFSVDLYNNWYFEEILDRTHYFKLMEYYQEFPLLVRDTMH